MEKKENVITLDQDLLVNQLKNVMNRPSQINNGMSKEKAMRRAKVIEDMFKLMRGFDARFVFSAMSRFDCYYAKNELHLISPEQIRLTTYAALWLIAEKQKTEIAEAFLNVNQETFNS